MNLLLRVSRVVGRTAAMTFVARIARRYPLVTVSWFVWRRWKRHSARTERSVVRLRSGESVTITDRVG